MGFLGIVMAMVVIFIIICALFLIGICSLIACIVLNCVFSKKWHEGKRYGKIVAIISRVGIGVSSFLMVPFIGMVIYVGVASSKVPEEFTDGTEISYNKKENYFYTDNEKYVVFMPVSPYSGKDYTEDYFAYKPSGMFMKSSWCDLKLYTTASGYTMFSYDHYAYVKEEELALAEAYYDEHYAWYQGSTLLEDEDQTAVEAIYQYYKEQEAVDALEKTPDMETYVSYTRRSDDELFSFGSLLLGFAEDTYYAYMLQEVDEDWTGLGTLLPQEFASFAEEALYIPEDAYESI